MADEGHNSLSLVQTAIYTTLNASVTYDGSIVPVFDRSPPNNPLPLILIGEDLDAPSMNLNSGGNRVECLIEVYTSGEGRKAAQTILKSIDVLLNNTGPPPTLNVTGYTVSRVARIQSRVITDGDSSGRPIYTGIVRYELFLQEN